MVAEDRPTATDVARIIAGTNPPSWLINSIKAVAFQRLWFARRIEGAQPGRAEMYEKLECTEKAAEWLLRVLRGDDMPTLGHLDGQRPLSANTLNSLAGPLRELRDRAKDAKGAIRKGGGRDAAWPIASASPMVHCAMLISEVWELHHGAAPKPGNTKAQEAASALWRASGADENGWGESFTGWRRHFQMIKKYEDERRLIHEMLVRCRRNGSY